jgi:ABC-type multidrug transport system fused ATPase/permease subunit
MGTLPSAVNSSRKRLQKGKAGLRPAFPPNLRLAYVEMKYIHDQESSAIQQNDVAADHYVLALWRRRRQAPLEVLWATYNLLLQAGRQSAPHHQLALQAGRQAIALGQAGRQVIAVLAIPAPHLVAVVVRVRVAAVIFIFIFIRIVAFAVSMAMIVVIVAILLIVAVTIALGNGQGARKGQAKNRACPDSQPYLK